MGNEIKQQEQIKLPQDFQALIAGFFPNTKYFDSRFDLLQVQIDESRRNQDQIKDQLKDFKGDTDKRFEQVDNRFQRLEDKIDNLIERIDVKVDSCTLFLTCCGNWNVWKTFRVVLGAKEETKKKN